MLKDTLVETVSQKIRTDIIRGDLSVGEKINIKSLAEKYNVSETPLKQALISLASENLIEIVPRHGMWIKKAAPSDIDATFDLRLMMDLYFIPEIISTVNFSPELRGKMEQNIQQHLGLVDQDMEIGDFIDSYSFDLEFHLLYLKCSGNPKLVELFRSLNPLGYFPYIYHKQTRERELEGVKEHEKIFKAILSKNPELLRQAVTDHLINSKRAISLVLRVNNII